MPGDDILDRDLAVGDGTGEQKCAGLNTVREDSVLTAFQFLDALDLEVVAADAVDFGPHLDEHVAEVDDFRFTGGAFNGC